MALTKVTSGLISADAASVDLNIDAGTLYIDATNNRVGVGTTSPTYNLSVENSSGNVYIQAKRASQSQGQVALELSGGTSGTNWVIYQPTSSDDLRIFGNSLDRITISSSGNVGIGATSLLSPGGSDATTLTVKATQYPQIFMIASSAAANSTTYRQIVRHTREYQIQAMNDSGGGEQTAYEINRASGSSSIDSQKWFAGTSEAMRLDSSGRLLVNRTTDGGYNGYININQTFGSGTYNIVTQVNSTTSQGHNQFVNPNGSVGTITTSGSATQYNTSSDYRLKENINYNFNALERVAQLKPARFNFIADADTTVDGFLAHEVSDIVPEAIHGIKDEMQEEEYEVTPAVLDEDGNVVTEAVIGTREVPKYQGIDQSKLIPLLTKAIQEQQTLIEELKTRIETLENA